MTYHAIGYNSWETSALLKITCHDRILTNSPPYYTSPIIHMITLFSRGGSVVVDRSMLFGNTLLELLEKNECTGFGGVPVHFSRLAGLDDECVLPPG